MRKNFASKILEKAKISISSVIEKENIKVSLKIEMIMKLSLLENMREVRKRHIEKPAADKRKKSRPAEQEKDKTIVAEIAEAKQQPEEKITQKPVQNNNQPTAQHRNKKPEQKL